MILCGIFITTSDANIHEVDVVRLTNQVLIEVYDIPEEIDLESSRQRSFGDLTTTLTTIAPWPGGRGQIVHR